MTPRILRLSITFLLAFTFSGIADAKLYPVGSPTRAIQDLDALLDGYIISPQTQEEKEHNRSLKKQALEGTFDIRELARISMDKHWKDLTPKEQEHFVDTLSQLLERKAVFAKEQGSGDKKKGSQYSISYQGHNFLVDKVKALVKSWVRIPNENLRISLDYKVHHVQMHEQRLLDPIFKRSLPVPSDWAMKEEWKIYNVIVDDASLVDNYRYQFDSIIRKGGYEDLIRRMESKLQEMIEKEAKEKETS